MSPDLVAQILAAVIPTIITMIVGFLTAHGYVSKRRVSSAYQFAVLAASAAEETFVPGNGSLKQQYVIEQLHSKFKLSDETAHLLVQAAVQGLRQSGVKQDAPAPTTPPVQAVA